MKKIGISFVGTGNYGATIYCFEDKQYNAKIFTNAFDYFFDFDKLFVVMTQEAKKNHIENIVINKEIEIIDIPDGKNEEELWQIFEIISKAVPNESSIFIDITHSLRSLPILGLSIAVYLRKAKSVSVKRIVYGAYEVRDQNKTPVFDLTSFLDLIDWSVATNQFVKHGNSEYLKDILTNIHKDTYLKRLDYKSQTLSGFGGKLNELTDALATSRILEALHKGKELAKKQKDINKDLEKIYQAKPLSNLLEKVTERFSEYKDAESLFTPEGFIAQTKMITYYLDTKNYLQAAALSREILVSSICIKMDIMPLVRDDRKNAEDHLNALSHDLKNGIKNKENRILIQLWEKITNIRNDLLHCGMREERAGTNRAVSSVTDTCIEIIDFIQKEYSNE